MSSRSSGPTRYRHTGSGSIPDSLNIVARSSVAILYPRPAQCRCNRFCRLRCQATALPRGRLVAYSTGVGSVEVGSLLADLKTATGISMRLLARTPPTSGVHEGVLMDEPSA